VLLAAYVAGFALTAVVSIAVGWWVHHQTDDRAGTAMVALLGVHALMGALVAVQLLVEPFWLKSLLSRLWWSLIFVAPAVWFAFAVTYTGRGYWLTRPVWGMLGLSVALPVALVLTEPSHGLLFEDAAVVETPFRHLSGSLTGTGMGAFAATNLLTLAGFGLLLQLHLTARRATWWQTGALLVGMVAVFGPAVLSATALAPVQGLPYGVLGAGVFGVVVALATFRSRMFGVAPLARNALFGALEDGILVVDADHRVVDFNDRAAALLPGLEENVAAPLEDAYPSLLAGSEPAPEEFPSQVGGGEGEGPFAPAVYLPPAEQHTAVRVAVSTIASGGEPRGYALVLRDVTDIEAHAAALERKTDQLERFASVLSHDLRNPVAVAKGRLELERESTESENLDIAADAVERIEETIADLLTLSREAASIEDPEPVSLRAVVEDAWTTTDVGDVTLENDVDPEVRVYADRSRLQTLLENLLRNVGDHGGETVRVGALDGGFYLEDDGPGIPEADRKRVFEYGHSGGDGTGFGLAIVETVAQAHGWSVAVTDGDTGGARFEVTGVSPDGVSPGPG